MLTVKKQLERFVQAETSREEQINGKTKKIPVGNTPANEKTYVFSFGSATRPRSKFWNIHPDLLKTI